MGAIIDESLTEQNVRDLLEKAFQEGGCA